MCWESTEITSEKELIMEPPEAYGDDGVDVTIIRWMLSTPPCERVQVLQDAVRSIMRLRLRER